MIPPKLGSILPPRFVDIDSIDVWNMVVSKFNASVFSLGNPVPCVVARIGPLVISPLRKRGNEDGVETQRPFLTKEGVSQIRVARTTHTI